MCLQSLLMKRLRQEFKASLGHTEIQILCLLGKVQGLFNIKILECWTPEINSLGHFYWIVVPVGAWAVLQSSVLSHSPHSPSATCFCNSFDAIKISGLSLTEECCHYSQLFDTESQWEVKKIIISKKIHWVLVRIHSPKVKAKLPKKKEDSPFPSLHFPFHLWNAELGCVSTWEHSAHFRYPHVLIWNVLLEFKRFLQSPDVCFGSQCAGAVSLCELILQSVSSLPLNTQQPCGYCFWGLALWSVSKQTVNVLHKSLSWARGKLTQYTKRWILF